MNNKEKLYTASLLIKRAEADPERFQRPMHTTGAGILGAVTGATGPAVYGGLADDSWKGALSHGGAAIGGGLLGALGGSALGVGLGALGGAGKSQRDKEMLMAILSQIGGIGGSIAGTGTAATLMAKRHNKKLREEPVEEETEEDSQNA